MIYKRYFPKWFLYLFPCLRRKSKSYDDFEYDSDSILSFTDEDLYEPECIYVDYNSI